ncbi:hypothetical protein D3C87_81650 [compost metagenome]
MISAKMLGGIYNLNEKDIRPRLSDFIDLIDGYGVILLLAGEEKEVEKQYILQDVGGIKVQTVIGKNYRINLYEDDSIDAIFIINGVGYDAIKGYIDSMNELSFEHNTTYSNSNKGLSLKSVVKIKVNEDAEEIMKLLSLFKIY